MFDGFEGMPFYSKLQPNIVYTNYFKIFNRGGEKI